MSAHRLLWTVGFLIGYALCPTGPAGGMFLFGIFLFMDNLSSTSPAPPTTPLRFDIVSLFPDFFTSPLSSGLIGRALKNQIATVHITNPRDFTTDKHHKVDDIPYGGGVGMVMKPDPIFAAVESLPALPRRDVILLSPQGQTMNQALFQSLSTDFDQLILICGHYEGVDERVMNIVTREVSLGDFVLTCGEIPALTLINGTIRLKPGTVGKPDSLKYDSFQTDLLDYPHYTRPAKFRDWAVPDVLLSGNHGAIAKWREQQQLERTRDRRPDLFERWQHHIPDHPTEP